jgi:hypothetical protein
MSEAVAEDIKDKIEDSETKPDEEVVDSDNQEGDETSDETKLKAATEEEVDEEIEVVREIKGSPPKKADSLPMGVRKRLSKLKAKAVSAKDEVGKANEENAVLRERLKLLELQAELTKEEPTTNQEPNPDDFDEGESDPKFLKKQRAFDNSVIKSDLRKEFAETAKQNVVTENQTRKSKQRDQKLEEHYGRVAGMKAKDYFEVEDQAIEYMGEETVKEIIENFDDPHILLYYLGANKGEAEELVDTIKSNPIRGTAAIGRLQSELMVKPKSKKIPNPDEDLEGGTSSGNMTADERKLDKLRAEADKTGNINKVLAFKREMKEKAKK